MFTSLARSLAPQEKNEMTIKIDSASGFAEFPGYGDSKKHLLPIFIDPESEPLLTSQPSENIQKPEHDADRKEFWMPDKFCKTCYGCEDAFTMFKRKHHCRMCGQVFCSPCSNFYIDGHLINLQGQVRSCRLCYDQMFERSNRDSKLMRRRENPDADSNRLVTSDSSNHLSSSRPGAVHEVPISNVAHINNLQRRYVTNS